MGAKLRQTRTAKARGASRSAPAAPGPGSARPGLPLDLLTGDRSTETGMQGPPGLRDVARNAERSRDLRETPSEEDTVTPDPEAEDGSGEEDSGAAQTEAEVQPEAGADEGEGGQGGDEGGAPPRPGGTGSVGGRRATPAQIPRNRRQSPMKGQPRPVIPRVEIPDRAYIRSPLVPAPPETAVEKRLTILKSTGSLPEAHHAQVQRAVDEMTDAARTSQREVIARVGAIAARTRDDIAALAARIPAVVAGGAAQIRAGAAQVGRDVDTVADRQIQAIIDKATSTEETQREGGNETAQTMHAQLMEQGPQVLRDLKAEMDTALNARKTQAQAQIRGIKEGREPQGLDTADPVGDRQRAKAQAEADEASPPSPIEAPTPPTWDAAEERLAGRLAQDMTDARMAQFANFRSAQALPALADAEKEQFDASIDTAAENVGSPEMVRQFFEATMGLTVPLVREEERNADPADDNAYIGAFRGQLGEAFMTLRGDARAAARQIDQKRIVLKEETLNPDHDGSLPHAGIKGLREAGRKIQQGLEDQARVIEASLEANLARLAVEYPALVERLRPMVETGEFLEATITLARISEARAGIPELERGHIEMVAEQAQMALRQARESFDQQVASLRKTAAKSVEGMQEYGARAHYDIARTAVSYTGIIDEGLAAAMPQIFAHAERTAERLMGPPQRAQMGYSNIATSAILHLNGAITGEWRRYLMALEGLEEKLGGVATGEMAANAEEGTEFGRIRQAVMRDSRNRAEKIEQEMSPAPLDAGDRVLAYGGAAMAAPFTGGASVYGVVAYDVYSDPDESDIVKHLSIPWPGPAAVDEAQVDLRNRTSLPVLIRQRLQSEGEMDDIIGLFSADTGVRSQSRTNLIAGADDWGGIGGEAALALSASYTPGELSTEFMSPADRARMGQSLEGALDDSTDREIAAAYINGDPDLALSLRMRQLIDRQRGKDYNEQLQTGQRLDRMIQTELWGGSQYAYIPQAQLDAARNTAITRFPETVSEGRQPVSITREASFRPIERPAEPAPSAPAPQPGADVAEAAAPPPSAAPTAAPDQRLPEPETTPEPAPQRPALERNPPTTADREAREQPTLEQAQDAVIAYMNRSTGGYQTTRDNRHVEGNLDRYQRMDAQHQERSYDPETGRVTFSPAASIQAMNAAIIRNGPSSPEARGATAAASMAWLPTHGEPSENQLNRLNESFSDNEFNAIRVRYENASPRERDQMADQWQEAQERHQKFLRAAASQMGLPEEQRNDPQAVEEFLSDRVGEHFARVDSDFRGAGAEIISQGRISIDTGMDIAATGWWGTNEALAQSVLAGRSEEELSAERGNGETMRQYATRIAESELSGDDWLQAREKLRGPDANDFERHETLDFLVDQQLEEGTSWLSEMTMEGSWQREDLLERRQQGRDRMTAAMQAGIDEARRRGIDLPDDIPESAFKPDGTLHPLARRFAMDGDGNLRGSGPSMGSLVGDTRQAADSYRAEIDRQEGIFTTAITTLAILASVVALLIPGVNAVAAGILVALLAGAATVAVKSGMRGSRYGMEEAAVDVGMAAVEAATAGAGASLSKGVRVAQVARAAKVAGDAAEAARAAQAVTRLGRLGRAGAAMSNRLGPVGAAVMQEGVSGAVSGAANAAMNDRVWQDGISRGVLRMAGHSVQGAAANALNAGISAKVSSGLDNALAPVAGNPKTAGAMSRIGGSLSGGQRELISETVSGLSGSLSSEGVNILADLARDPDKMTMKVALERLGKNGLQNLIGTASKSALQQGLRAGARKMSRDIMAEGRDPTPAEARVMRQLSLAGGLIQDDVSTADYAANFSRARARIAQMPPELHPYLHRMTPEKALQVVSKLDSGDLGTRAQRVDFVNSLGQQGIDLRAFDKALVQANEDHAPERRARKTRLRAAQRTLAGGVRGPERVALNRVDMADLADLPPDMQRRLSRALAAGETDFDPILERLDNAGMRKRARATLDLASRTLAEARTEFRVQRARIRDDLRESAPEALRDTLAALKDRDAAALHKALQDESPAGRSQAEAILRRAGMPAEEAGQALRQLAPRLEEQAQRRLFTDNVPDQHRETMGQLSPDALMEIRVAQFTRNSLSDERIDQIVTDASGRRPGANPDLIRTAIEATLKQRHGRPRFREALAQKRAFLSLIPWGMKADVLRTPILTLPDSAFLAYVRGKGDENAVTLILNGEPVVLIRQGASARALAEEGSHVLQWHDPQLRTRMSELDERRLTRWNDLDLDDQIDTYGRKVGIEIDAQERMIARLSQKAERALWPGARRRIREELVSAHEALNELRARRVEVDALTPERRRAIEAGEETRPGWLKQPARMFNKDPKLFDREMPGARTPVRDAYFDLVEQFPNLPRDERKRLLGLLRTMKGAASVAEITSTLKHFTGLQKAANKAGKPGLPSVTLVSDILDHMMHKARVVSVSVEGRATPLRTRDMDKRKKAVKGLIDERFSDADQREAFKQTVDALLDLDPSDPPELATAKAAMFLALEKYHGNASDDALAERLTLTGAVLGVDKTMSGDLSYLHDHKELQAFVLEGLATNKALARSGGGRAQADQESYIAAVRNLVGEGGIRDYPPDVQRRVFATLARSYFAGAAGASLLAIGDLPRSMRETSGQGSLDNAINLLRWTQELIAHVPPSRLHDFLPKLNMLIRYDVDMGAFSPEQARRRGKLTSWEIKNFITRASAEMSLVEAPTRLGKFASSLSKAGHRTSEAFGPATAEEVSQGRGLISEGDLERIGALTPFASDPRDFLDRHARDPEGTGIGQDVSTPRNDTVDWILDRAQQDAAEFGLTRPEARAIAQRIQVLDQSGLLGPLIGKGQTRAEMMAGFLKTLDKSSLGDVSSGEIADLPADTQRARLNARGDKVEEAFRRYVRDLAVGRGKDPGLLGALADTPKVRISDDEITLLPEARLELLFILARGQDKNAMAKLSETAREQIRAVRDEMVRLYVDRLSGDPEHVAAADAKIRDSLTAMFGTGLTNIETQQAKGKMFEHVVEGLLALEPSETNAVPKRFGQLRSVKDASIENPDTGAPEAVRHSFRSGDQRPQDAPRSLDHVVQVRKARAEAEAPGPAKGAKRGFDDGEVIGIDSKNGSGAFDHLQFRRYLVEMLRGAASQDGSIFGKGASKLDALMYVADSSANAKTAHAEVTKVIKELLEAVGDRTDGTVMLKIGDYEEPIDIADLRRFGRTLRIHFAHIGQFEGPGSTAGQTLGPFRVAGYDPDPADLFARKWREDAAETGPDPKRADEEA